MGRMGGINNARDKKWQFVFTFPKVKLLASTILVSVYAVMLSRIVFYQKLLQKHKTEKREKKARRKKGNKN